MRLKEEKIDFDTKINIRDILRNYIFPSLS